MTRLIQIKNGNIRRVALVEEPNVRFLDGCSSIYELAQIAIDQEKKLSEVARQRANTTNTTTTRSTTAARNGGCFRRLIIQRTRSLPRFRHWTHAYGQRSRSPVHARHRDRGPHRQHENISLGSGRRTPEAGRIGTPPEWFHKGTGSTLRAHGEPLDVPSYADDGGEEAEIAGVYIIARDGRPYRIGMAVGNEFSDHEFEKKNYLYLAGSKLRTCALGPEIVLDCEFNSIPVTATILREGAVLWTKTFRTGESEMCHSLQNIEHHHFKFEAHRRPRRYPRAFLWHRLPELQRSHPFAGWRYHASGRKRFRARSDEPRPCRQIRSGAYARHSFIVSKLWQNLLSQFLASALWALAWPCACSQRTFRWPFTTAVAKKRNRWKPRELLWPLLRAKLRPVHKSSSAWWQMITPPAMCGLANLAR